MSTEENEHVDDVGDISLPLEVALKKEPPPPPATPLPLPPPLPPKAAVLLIMPAVWLINMPAGDGCVVVT